MQVNWDFLTRALAQNISSDEKEILQQWLRESNVNRELWQQMQRRRQELDNLTNDTEMDAQWRRIQSAINAPSKMAVVKKMNIWSYAVASCAAVIVIATVFLVTKNTGNITQVQLTINASAKGRKLLLPDGSTVWLSTGAVLQYDSAGFTSKRELTLNGNAFFDVAKNKEKPFKIHATHLKVTVVGTSFGVYAGVDVQQVKVATGIVTVDANGRETKLLAGDALSFEPSKHNIQLTKVTTAEALALHQNKLVFDKDDLQTIASKLEDWYDKKVIIEGSAGKPLSFTGAINDDSITHVLEGLTFMTGAAFTIKNNQIIIYPKQ